jgi:hypothetical protein
VKRRYDLDSFGEIYDGFSRDREFFKASVRRPKHVWRKAFDAMSKTDELYQRGPESIARETMRVLLDALRGA